MNTYNLLHLLLWGAGLALCIAAYSQMPDTIDVHFDAAGNANRQGSKNEIWILLGIWMWVAGIMEFVRRNPNLANSYVPGLSKEQLKVYNQTSIKELPLLSLLTGVILFISVVYLLSSNLDYGEFPMSLFWIALICYLGAIGLIVWKCYRVAKDS